MREKPVTEFKRSTLELAYIGHVRWLTRHLVTEEFDIGLRRAKVLKSELRRRGIDPRQVEKANHDRLYR